MPSFSDSIVLFILALMLFGPKRLPKLARELGKWVGEFRRASNEFKMQMDEELRVSEQADRQKQIAAMEAAAPVAPAISEAADAPVAPSFAESATTEPVEAFTPGPAYEMVDGVRTAIPIATSGELHLMPPSTGLPAGRNGSPLGGLLRSIPETDDQPELTPAAETAAHGD